MSCEREVSLSSAKGIIEAVKELGHEVIPIDVTFDIAKLVQDLTPKPDVVINILHGRWGEDGRIQGLLDLLRIPYTFSGVISSSIAMHKKLSLMMFKQAGLPIAKHMFVSTDEAFAKDVMQPPYVIKPIHEGSSVGVYVVHESKDRPTKPADWDYGDEVVVEEYIPGKELSVAVMGDKAIGVLELRPKYNFYDYTAKYSDGITEHFMPAPIHENSYKQALELAEKAVKLLGCEGISRVDFRYDDTNGEPGRLIILEVNSQPGLTPLSIAPEILRYAGYEFNDLVQWMIDKARCRLINA